MKNRLLLLGALMLCIKSSGCGLAWAGGTCTVCFDDVPDEKVSQHSEVYACSKGHCLHLECLAHQVRSSEKVLELESKGLSCCGKDGKCKERISFQAIRATLKPQEREALDLRIAKAKAPGVGPKTLAQGNEASLEESQEQIETRRTKIGIDDAFNLCCPKGGCGSTLGNIEGCNAATCSNDSCRARFCYLCLEPQRNDRSAHQHTLKHSGEFWERRPGVKDRYHWLVARKKLALLFEGRPKQFYHRFVDSFQKQNQAVDIPLEMNKVRGSALEGRKAILEERNMWPMPAGIATTQWLAEVAMADLPEKKRTQILQNEYAFRRQQQDLKNAKLIESELKRIGAPAFRSFDVGDVEACHRTNGLGKEIADFAGDLAPIVHKITPPRLTPVMEGDQRVNQEFARLGSMYEVEGVIFSGVPKEGMNHDRATEYCRSLGEGYRLPTKDELENFSAALGYPNRYNPDQVPDQSDKGFWSSSVDRYAPSFYYLLSGNYGFCAAYTRFYDGGSIRCVRLAERR